MKSKGLTVVLLLTLASSPGAAGQDLFAEAGHELGRSRWVNIRFLPAINIALEADDVVLVMSLEHPAKSLAMKIDGDAVAADCAVTETKDSEYSVATEENHKKKTSWTTTSTTTTTTYWAKCVFDAGVSDRAQSAHEIVVQVAMTNGNTKPHTLNSKELRKFQTMKQ
jgi:hypothetical protein